MPILNPNHLIEQAERLIAAPAAGPPRQVDLRRAISSAYYALFHMTLTALADDMIGAFHRTTNRYALVHRSIEHRTIRDLCLIVSKNTPPDKYKLYVPVGGFKQDMQTFASAFGTLYRERHLADYDVAEKYRTLRAEIAISTSKSGIANFTSADATERKAFLTLLLCTLR